jgi:STE24 endopeptidase
MPPRHVVRNSLLVLALVLAGPASAAGEPVTPAAAQGGLDVEATTDAYLARLSPEARARSNAYFEGGYVLQLVDTVVTIAVMLLLLESGLSRRIRDWTERRSRYPWLQRALYWSAYLAVTTALTFPLSLYEGFFREHAYGLSNQSFAAWLGDFAKGLAVALVLGAALVTVLYAVVARMSRSWWALGAIVTIVFVTFLSLIFPVFVAPLFNTYTRLADERVRAPILRMAAANGLATDDVWVSDASRQSKRISANVSGLLGTERITLNDNLLNRCTPAQIQAVMGHELGHYVLNHGYKFLAFLALIILGLFAALRALVDWTLGKWGTRWGVRGLADPAGLPIAILWATVLFLLLTPVLNTLIRVQEQEADVFGLNAAREPDAFAEVALQLSEYRKLSPGPLEEFIFFDHPSGRTRIRTAMRWKANQPPR